MFRICLSHLIYTVRPCLIHTFHTMPMPCSDHAVLLKATAQHGRLSTAVLCCGLQKNGMVGAWHGHGMESVNQTWPHCVNQMGKTNSKPLAAWHGRGTAWARHGNGMLCVNRPLLSFSSNREGIFRLSWLRAVTLVSLKGGSRKYTSYVHKKCKHFAN